MNLTHQTQSTIPEVGRAMPLVQTLPDSKGIYSTDLADTDTVEIPVIARFPDLDAPATPIKRRSSSRTRTAKPITYTGRILSASMSLKILVGLCLLLMIGAVAQNVVIKISDTFLTKNNTSSDQAWQIPSPAPTADVAPPYKPEATALKSTSTAPDKATNTKNNSIDTGNLVRWDNNIPQSKPTIPITALRAPESLPSTSKTAAMSAGKASTSSKSLSEAESAALARLSAWPRNAESPADFSPWPHPAHPIMAQTDSKSYSAAPLSVKPTYNTEPAYNQTSTIPVLANRPMTIGSTESAPSANPADRYDSRGGVSNDSRRTEPFTADRRNSPASNVDQRISSVPPVISPDTARQRSFQNEPGSAQYDGATNNNSDRNSHEYSR